jgi:hypothetical protein
MNIIKRASLLAAALAVVSLGAAPSYAQEPQPRQPPSTERPAKAAVIEGELVAVDTESKRIAIKTANGAEEQLRYTDDTRVVGGQGGVAGLANSAKTMVSVRFAGSGADRVATEIVVHEKK